MKQGERRKPAGGDVDSDMLLFSSIVPLLLISLRCPPVPPSLTPSPPHFSTLSPTLLNNLSSSFLYAVTIPSSTPSPPNFSTLSPHPPQLSLLLISLCCPPPQLPLLLFSLLCPRPSSTPSAPHFSTLTPPPQLPLLLFSLRCQPQPQLPFPLIALRCPPSSTP